MLQDFTINIKELNNEELIDIMTYLGNSMSDSSFNLLFDEVHKRGMNHTLLNAIIVQRQNEKQLKIKENEQIKRDNEFMGYILELKSQGATEKEIWRKLKRLNINEEKATLLTWNSRKYGDLIRSVQAKRTLTSLLFFGGMALGFAMKNGALVVFCVFSFFRLTMSTPTVDKEEK